MTPSERADSWDPSGLVTLLSDFGHTDPYVGIMKGVLHARCRQATCVDLTHGVPAQDVVAAAWYLAHSWRWFPRGTVHVAVVDPGVGSDRALLVAEEDGHAFLAPDNGLLGPSLSDSARVLALDVSRFALEETSSTFHGRDVFAPAAAALASGLPPTEAGTPVEDWRRVRIPEPVRLSDGWIESEVLLVDSFGNLITALRIDGIAGPLAEWVVEVAGREVPCAGTYSEVEAGEPLALVDSYGHLEIAVRDGDAARELGLGRGAPVILRRRT